MIMGGQKDVQIMGGLMDVLRLCIIDGLVEMLVVAGVVLLVILPLLSHLSKKFFSWRISNILDWIADRATRVCEVSGKVFAKTWGWLAWLYDILKEHFAAIMTWLQNKLLRVIGWVRRHIWKWIRDVWLVELWEILMPISRTVLAPLHFWKGFVIQMEKFSAPILAFVGGVLLICLCSWLGILDLFVMLWTEYLQFYVTIWQYYAYAVIGAGGIWAINLIWLFITECGDWSGRNMGNKPYSAVHN